MDRGLAAYALFAFLVIAAFSLLAYKLHHSHERSYARRQRREKAHRQRQVAPRDN